MLVKVVKRSVVLMLGLCLIIAANTISACQTAKIVRQIRCYIVYATAADENTVKAYGGAGYALKYNGREYMSVVCEKYIGSANDCAQSLAERGLDCKVLCCERTGFTLLNYSAECNAEKYAAIIDALIGIFAELDVCCKLAASSGAVAVRSKLASVARSVASVLAGEVGCFKIPLTALFNSASKCAYGAIIFPREVYALQLAVADILLNISLT